MNRVVVGVNKRQVSRDALEWAYGAAVRERVALEVVTVYQPAVAVSPIDGYVLVDDRNARLSAFAAQAAALDDVLSCDAIETPIRCVVLPGDPVGVLLERAAHACLLVVGRRVRRKSRWLRPSTSTRCAEHSVCPVVVVREQVPRNTRAYRAELRRLERDQQRFAGRKARAAPRAS
jgi:nucleotide-binding universal stress UspA family protein